MAYVPLHATRTVTILDPGFADLGGGYNEPASESTVVTLTPGVQDITDSYVAAHQGPEGRDVRHAFRLFTGDTTTTIIAGKHVATMDVDGATERFEVANVKAFRSASPHRQIVIVSRQVPA